MPTEMENTTIYQSAENILASANGPTITFNTSSFTLHNPWEEKLKEYCSSTDKHVDELEGDIDFLDKERKNATDMLVFHNDKIGELESKLELLKNENIQLHNELNTLHTQIYDLQQRLDNQ